MDDEITFDRACKWINKQPLNVKINSENGKITDVDNYRCHVIWKGDNEKSGISYCNICGASFIEAGTYNVEGKEYKASRCADCSAFQGWDEKHPFGKGVEGAIK